MNAPLVGISLAVGILSLGGSAEPLNAQQNSHAGRWQCEHAAYTNRNVAADNYTISWVMELAPDGGLRAEGTAFSQVVGYPDPVQGSGRWGPSTDGAAVMIQGAWYMAGQELPFEHRLRPSGATLIENTNTQIGRTSTLCERFGG